MPSSQGSRPSVLAPVRRLGLFGGTFDPPHVGHLALAEWARERLELDRVLFIPTGRSPHKRRTRVSGSEHRLAMTRIAVRGNRAFRVSTIEVRADGPSFTVETVRRVADAWPGSRLFVLLGADSLDEFDTWHEPGAILELATLAVAGRPGASRRARVRARGGRRIAWIGSPGLEVSSSMIRSRVRAGRSVRYLVPEAVVRYIERHRLYRRSRSKAR